MPENARPDARYEYVGFWVRVAATLLDTALLLAIILPLLGIIYGEDYWLSGGLVYGLWDVVLNWVLPVVAVLLFWRLKQATPGKMVFHATIVDARSGKAPSLGQWIVRYLGYIVSFLPFGLGYLWVGWDPRKQAWHDKLAGTVVVRPKSRGVEPVHFEGGAA